MVHQNMLLQVALKSGYIATQIAENGFSPAWSSGICSFRFFFALATCHKTCREGPHSSMVQRSMLLEVLVHTVLVATKHAGNGFTSVWIIGVCFFRLNFGLVILPQNLQRKASLLYGSMEYALSGWTSYWPF